MILHYGKSNTGFINTLVTVYYYNMNKQIMRLLGYRGKIMRPVPNLIVP
jgi:hypothetical protein